MSRIASISVVLRQSAGPLYSLPRAGIRQQSILIKLSRPHITVEELRWGQYGTSFFFVLIDKDVRVPGFLKRTLLRNSRVSWSANQNEGARRANCCRGCVCGAVAELGWAELSCKVNACRKYLGNGGV